MNNKKKIIGLIISPHICYAILIIMKIVEPDYRPLLARTFDLNLFQRIWYNDGFILISWIIAGLIIANMFFIYIKIPPGKKIRIIFIIQIIIPFILAYILPRWTMFFWYNPRCINLAAVFTGIHIYFIWDNSRKLKGTHD